MKNSLAPQPFHRVAFLARLLMLACLWLAPGWASVAMAGSPTAHIDLWFDHEGRDDIRSLKQIDWSPLTGGQFNRGITPGSVWLRVTLDRDAAGNGGYLYLDNPLLTDIVVFSGQIQTALLQSGRLHPSESRAARIPQWALPLQASPVEDAVWYVRVRSDVSLRSQVQWLDAAGLASEQTTSTLVNAAYYGVALIMAAFYTLVWFQTRERVYLWFTLGLLSFLVVQLEMDGILLQYVYPQFPWLSFPVFQLGLVGIVHFTFRLATTFLELPAQQPRLLKAMSIADNYSLLMLASLLVLPRYMTVWLNMPYLLGGGLLCLMAGIRPLQQRNQSGIYYMLAISSVAIGSMFYLMMIVGIFEGNALLEGLLKLSNSLQVLLLGFALIDRYRRIQDERHHYQQLMVDTLFEANRIKDEFLNMISHELRTPLNGIQGALDMMRGLPLDDAMGQNVGMAETSLKDMLKMVDAILDWTELNNNSVEPKHSTFGLPGDFTKLMDVYRKSPELKGRPLALTVAPDVHSHYQGDSRKLFKALRCLIDNAIKFGADGPIDVSLSRASQRDDSDTIEISIGDRGPGIPADRLETMFEAFTQGESGLRRRFQGLGLGLPVARGLIHALGGKLILEPREGGGTLARITLAMPRAQPPVAVEAPAVAPRAVSEGPLRMLVVEDNLVNQKVLTAILSKLGGEVSVANDGQEAVDKTRDQTFDFIWMDCQMPVMDGLEATRRIRQLGHYADTPIVAVTANALAEDEKRCLEAGMNDFLAKPVNKGAVERMLRKWAAQQAA